MAQQNIEIVRRVFEAFNNEDIERIVEFMHPDLEVEIPAELSAEPDTYRGPDGIRRYFRSFGDALEEVRFEPERMWESGQSVVVDLRLTARGRQTSIPVEQRSTGVWTIRDGRVVSVRAYGLRSEAFAAAGLRE
jgi:ketosteroid isomerase-like protein